MSVMGRMREASIGWEIYMSLFLSRRVLNLIGIKKSIMQLQFKITLQNSSMNIKSRLVS